MKRFDSFFFCFHRMAFVLLLLPGTLWAQQTSPNADTSKIISSGNRIFISISMDNRIVFSSDKNGKDNLYLLTDNDSTVQITYDSVVERHPVWAPHKNAIVYDAGTGKSTRLFYFNLETKKRKLLFHRAIAAREASFTPSRHLVAFSGFDDRTQRWQIFTYDFVYDNLNRLTAEKGNCRFPVFSPDGKHIVFAVQEDNGTSRLKIMNWYGDNRKVLVGNTSGRVCWTPDSWRILFVSKNGNKYCLNSIINDGTGLKEIFSVSYPICCPALSADGKKLILSKKTDDKFQIKPYLFSNKKN